MKIAEFSVKNRQFTIVAFVALLAAGAWSLVTIPRAEDPTFPFPIFPIVAVYPGASPADLEQLVVDPIEKRVRALEGIKKVRSQVEDGLAFIRVEFEFEVDPDKKYDEVVREVNALRTDLPQGIVRLTVDKTSAADVNILQAAIVSETAPWHEIDARARTMRDALERVHGIKKAELWGYPKREVEVALDLGKLSALRVPVSQLLQAIGGESLNIPGGAVDAGDRKSVV